MTGLEKIISTIESESNDRCQSIIENARKKAEEIISQAKAQAQKEAAETESVTAKKIENIKQSAISSAELNKSKIILSAKLEIIDSMLKKSLEEIKALPDSEYFEIIETLIVNNAKYGEGVLRMSEKDIKRLPSGFIEKINAGLSDNKKVVLGDSVDIDSGFVLVYGDIDINCSFNAIASSKRDELRDALNALLFD